MDAWCRLHRGEPYDRGGAFAGAHLPRLKVPIPLHLLLGRRIAFSTFRALSRHAPWTLREQVTQNSFIKLARQGVAKPDDLLELVRVRRLRAQISTLRATAGGGAETMLSGSTIVAADSSGISYERTTDQVLHIVYLSPTAGVVSKGGFFPNGLNGTIKATAS